VPPQAAAIDPARSPSPTSRAGPWLVVGWPTERRWRKASSCAFGAYKCLRPRSARPPVPVKLGESAPKQFSSSVHAAPTLKSVATGAYASQSAAVGCDAPASISSTVIGTPPCTVRRILKLKFPCSNQGRQNRTSCDEIEAEFCGPLTRIYTRIVDCCYGHGCPS
jgi:hypothetical protein